jgi:hypothetical protein
MPEHTHCMGKLFTLSNPQKLAMYKHTSFICGTVRDEEKKVL